MAELENGQLHSRENKVAILISSLGGDLAKRVLESLDPGRARKLEERLAALGPLDPETVERVIDEFMHFVTEHETTAPSPPPVGWNEVEWQPSQDVHAEIEQERPQDEERSLSSVLERMDARMLANFTKGEHPQTIALILAHLESSKGGEVLSNLPEELQADVVLRLAELETVPSAAVRAVAEALEDQVRSVGTTEERIGGIKRVADILTQTGGSHERNILARIDETDPELSDRIRQDLFTFDDLAKVDDLGIREILKEITSQQLALSLKAASDEIKEKIFKNMSKRATEMLKEDIEALGPTRLSEVEQAQQAITRAALKLEADGRVIVSGRGKEEILV